MQLFQGDPGKIFSGKSRKIQIFDSSKCTYQKLLSDSSKIVSLIFILWKVVFKLKKMGPRIHSYSRIVILSWNSLYFLWEDYILPVLCQTVASVVAICGDFCWCNIRHSLLVTPLPLRLSGNCFTVPVLAAVGLSVGYETLRPAEPGACYPLCDWLIQMNIRDSIPALNFR